MTLLMCDRRVRGLAASTVNIPAVLVVGYAAHADIFDFKCFQSLDHISISKQDREIPFTEAVLCSSPSQASHVEVQVGMGVTFISSDLEVKAAHKGDVKFSHFIQREETCTDAQTVKTSAHFKVQLQEAKSAEKAYIVTCDAFWGHLERLLRISQEEKLDCSIGLIGQGVDPLLLSTYVPGSWRK